MNLIEIMDFDISNILSFTTDECITFCRDVMKSFQSYEVNDKYPLGHGEKSCYFLTKFIDLNISEYSAIRWHMGYSLPKDDYITLDNAMNSNPLLLALYEADLEASHLYEK